MESDIFFNQKVSGNAHGFKLQFSIHHFSGHLFFGELLSGCLQISVDYGLLKSI